MVRALILLATVSLTVFGVSLSQADAPPKPAVFSPEKLGRIDEARGLYRRGIEVTGAMGDDHTRSELQAALTMLG